MSAVSSTAPQTNVETLHWLSDLLNAALGTQLFPRQIYRDFKIEPWVGGRWFRDLGSNSGHLWGFVQSIKPPTLLEIFGPLMLSFPVAGHLIIRLTEIPEGTRLVFKNQVFGPIPDEYREGMGEGWGQMLSAVKRDL